MNLMFSSLDCAQIWTPTITLYEQAHDDLTTKKLVTVVVGYTL